MFVILVERQVRNNPNKLKMNVVNSFVKIYGFKNCGSKVVGCSHFLLSKYLRND